MLPHSFVPHAAQARWLSRRPSSGPVQDVIFCNIARARKPIGTEPSDVAWATEVQHLGGVNVSGNFLGQVPPSGLHNCVCLFPRPRSLV